MVRTKYIRELLLVCIYMLGVLGIVASGGGGGGGDDDVVSVSFPNPTLPANARTLDATNATDTATTAVEFLFVGASFTNYLKSATSPSIADILSNVIDEYVKKDRSSNTSLIGQKTEDISGVFCFTGTAFVEYSETDQGEIGTITFTTCDIGGVVLSGTLPYDLWWDDFSDNYDFRFGSDLVFDFGTEAATLVMDLIVTGDDVTFDWTHDIIYSLSVVPGDGFLVTTAQPWFGNAALIEAYGGQLIVTGANNTRLRITVTAINIVDVELDDGSGTFLFHDTIDITPLL